MSPSYTKFWAGFLIMAGEWMNSTQQKLFSRLRKTIDNISESPETAAVVTRIFENFVISIEDIVDDLKTTPDIEVAANLKAIIDSVDPDL